MNDSNTVRAYSPNTSDLCGIPSEESYQSAILQIPIPFGDESWESDDVDSDDIMYLPSYEELEVLNTEEGIHLTPHHYSRTPSYNPSPVSV